METIRRKYFYVVVLALFTVFASCSKDDSDDSAPKKEYFQLWNQCDALTTLQEYVEDVTNPKSANFISEEDRIATFDMDGTFVGELYPTYFEYNLLEYQGLRAQGHSPARPFRHDSCPCGCQGLFRHDAVRV